MVPLPLLAWFKPDGAICRKGGGKKGRSLFLFLEREGEARSLPPSLRRLEPTSPLPPPSLLLPLSSSSQSGQPQRKAASSEGALPLSSRNKTRIHPSGGATEKRRRKGAERKKKEGRQRKGKGGKKRKWRGSRTRWSSPPRRLSRDRKEDKCLCKTPLPSASGCVSCRPGGKGPAEPAEGAPPRARRRGCCLLASSEEKVAALRRFIFCPSRRRAP